MEYALRVNLASPKHQTRGTESWCYCQQYTCALYVIAKHMVADEVTKKIYQLGAKVVTEAIRILREPFTALFVTPTTPTLNALPTSPFQPSKNTRKWRKALLKHRPPPPQCYQCNVRCCKTPLITQGSPWDNPVAHEPQPTDCCGWTSCFALRFGKVVDGLRPPCLSLLHIFAMHIEAVIHIPPTKINLKHGQCN